MLASIIFAAALAAAPLAAVPADDIASAKPAIDAANADWAKALAAHDAAGVAAPYSETSVFVGADGVAIQGRKAFEAATAQRMARMGKVSGGAIIQEDLTNVAPGLIFEWGRGGFDMTGADGQTKHFEGRYLSVWRREADGVWRIVRNLSL